MIYFVTGGAGFIGSHIVDALVQQGHQVTVLDDLSNGRAENLANAHDTITFIEGDIRDRAVLRQAMAGSEIVLHLAAIGSVPRSIKHPELYYEVNIGGTLNVLQAAREVGVKRVVFSSSSSVYGPITEPKQVETLTPRPASPYALSKLACEHYVRLWHELYGLETINLRYFNVFGPRQNPQAEYAAVIPIFMAKLAAGEAPEIHGDGEQSRDFTYVANVAAANLAAAEASAEALGQVYNVAYGATTSVNTMLAKLQELFSTSLTPMYTPPRAGDVPKSHADTSLAKKNLGYAPQVSFDEGLAQTVEWFRQTQKAPV